MKMWDPARSRLRCLATMRVLQSYLDGTLDEVSTRRVAAHLEDCRRCGLEAEVYEQIKASLGQQDQPVDPRAIERLRQFGEQLAHGGPSTPDDHGA
ncbi:MAG: anti-sigma factor family protein [Steroidobacteraceae bacterium]